MKLKSFSVKGLLRFEHECRVDLAGLPAGLIAIIGENGAGKTTLAETPIAAFYRTLPSREHDLVDYATGRDSTVEADVSTGSGSYRARVNLDAVRRTSEAVLVHTDAGGIQTILNDGKVTTFDAEVAKVLPPIGTLLASAFSAQNHAGSFPQLDRKGRKALFASLLGLDHYETMATTARACAADLDRQRAVLSGQRELLQREADPARLAAIEAQLVDLAGVRGRLEAEAASTQTAIADAEAAHASEQSRVMEWQAATAALAPLRGQATTIEMEMSTLTQRGDRAEADARVEHQELTRKTESARADLAGRIANNQHVLEQAETIRAAVAAVATCDAEIVAQRAEVDTLQAERQQLQGQATTINQRLQVARDAAKDLVRAQEQATTLQAVPCGGQGTYAGCRFLTLAQQASGQIPALTLAAAPVAALLVETETISGQLTQVDANVLKARRAIAAAQTNRAVHAPNASLAEQLAVAQARLVELKTKIAESEQSAEQAHADIDTRFAALAVDIGDRLDSLGAEQATLTARIDALTATVAETSRSAGIAATLARQLADLRAALQTLAVQRATADATEAQLLQQQHAWHEAQTRLADLDALGRAIETDLLEWQFLAKALARDGLPTLEIAAAGPTVSQFANSLLESCFGPRFSVDLVTQEAKADGKGFKEVFELKVLDNARGGDARDLTDLSGGEQIIVDEALKNALTLFVNQRSATPTQTVWRDECTGPLDGENAGRYVAMLRKLAEIGGFWHVLFVTHNRDAAMAADAQIVVHDGTADVRQPPYPEAA